MPIKGECKYSYLNILDLQCFVQIFVIKKLDVPKIKLIFATEIRFV